MPLHLLGKKSWNVYNAVNIERVRKDEAEAKKAEEAEEQRIQEQDAERRMQILRGETPTQLVIEDKPPSLLQSPETKKRDRTEFGNGGERKRRKRSGENDTDFEMRVTKEDMERDRERRVVMRRESESNVSLVDEKGNISLFPQPKALKGTEKNKEVERESRKKKEYENQYTLRFSNAAGLKQGLDGPWYSKATTRKDGEGEALGDMIGKDVWGNEDPRRKEREIARVISNDPLATMKAGARQVREVERERKRWREEKERELRELKEAERSKRRKSRREEVDDGLEGFKLDEERPGRNDQRDRDKERERRHRHGPLSRSEHQEKDLGRRHRHRSRHHDE